MQMNDKQKELLAEAIKAGKAGETMRAQILWIQAHTSKSCNSTKEMEERTR